MKYSINIHTLVIAILLVLKNISAVIHPMQGYLCFPSEETIYNSFALQAQEYFVPTVDICIGRPPQCFNLGITTKLGFSFLSSSSDNPSFKKPLNSILSSTSNTIPLYKKISVYYQIYPVKGSLIEDYFSFKDVISKSFKPMALVLLDEHPMVNKVPFDGFIGMNRDNDPFNLKEHKEIKRKVSFNIYDSFGIRSINRQFALRYYHNYTGEFFLGENLDISNSYCNVPKGKERTWYCEAQSIQIANESHDLIKDTNVYFFSSGNLVSIPHRYSDKIINHVINKSNGLCRVDVINEVGLFFCETSMDFSLLSDTIIVFKYGRLKLKWKNMMSITTYNKKKMYMSKLIIESNWYHGIEIGIPAFLDNIIVFDSYNQRIGFLEDVKYCNPYNHLLPYIYLCSIIQSLIGMTVLFLLKFRKIK